MNARPYRSVVATGQCARTSFQIAIAFGPHWSSSQSQSLTQSVTGPESLSDTPYDIPNPLSGRRPHDAEPEGAG
jgi:hypothetical protein